MIEWFLKQSIEQGGNEQIAEVLQAHAEIIRLLVIGQVIIGFWLIFLFLTFYVVLRSAKKNMDLNL